MTGLSRLRLNRFFPYRLANRVAVVEDIGGGDQSTAERRGGWAVVADRLLLILQFCFKLTASR